jgi:hypothetical protein
MKKELVLITGSVLNSNPELTNVYTKLVSMIDREKYDVLSPLDTMKFEGTDKERYERAMEVLENTKVMIAEMSNVSTGQGMEIQRAATLGIPILVIAKENSKISGLVKGCPVVKKIIYYNEILLIKNEINDFIKRIGDVNDNN